MRRNNCLALLTLLSALSLSACGTSQVDNSKLVIGMECAYQPFNWTENKANEFTLPIDGTNEFADGYDIAVARYLSKDLGRDVVITHSCGEDCFAVKVSILSSRLFALSAEQYFVFKPVAFIDFLIFYPSCCHALYDASYSFHYVTSLRKLFKRVPASCIALTWLLRNVRMFFCYLIDHPRQDCPVV